MKNPELEKEVLALVSKVAGLPVACPVRTTRNVAKQLLLENRAMISGGMVFYFGIRNLGLGVCEVFKLHLSQHGTQMVP